MTEATFTEFSSSGTFDVVGGVGGPQTGSTTGFNESAQSQPSTVMHVQCGFDASMYTTCV